MGAVIDSNATNINDETLIADVVNSNYVSIKTSVSTTEVLANVSGSNLEARKQLIIWNEGNKTIYYGPTGVSDTGVNQGIPIEPKELAVLNYGDLVDVYLISSSPGADIIIQEVS